MSDPIDLKPVRAFAPSIPQHALAYRTEEGNAQPVEAAHPLPCRVTTPAAASTPLAASTAASTTAGPFVPEAGRPIWVTLSGAWTGSAQLLRSTDGGATRLPLTAAGMPWGSFTANANEAVVEESCADAVYYLAATIGSGTLSYRVHQ